MLEVPAGKIEHDGESPDYCAARELEEEAGVTASEILPLAIPIRRRDSAVNGFTSIWPGASRKGSSTSTTTNS